MIFDLWSHSHLWVVDWMDILTFFDILLKPPQSFTGLFLNSNIVQITRLPFEQVNIKLSEWTSLVTVGRLPTQNIKEWMITFVKD